MIYPKIKYHKTLAPEDGRSVRSEAEELALGPEWKESPGEFDQDPPVDEKHEDLPLLEKEPDEIEDAPAAPAKRRGRKPKVEA